MVTIFKIIFAVFLFFTPLSVLALGVTPSTVVVENIMPGTSLVRTVNITAPPSALERTLTVEVKGNQAPWLELSSNNLSLPSGVSSVPYVFTLVPTSRMAGWQEALLAFGELPSESRGNLTSRVEIKVRILVSKEEHHAFSLENVGFKNVERGEPLPLSLTVRNIGNVAVRMDKIAIGLRPGKSRTVLQSVIPVEDIPLISPFTTQTFTVVTDSSFPAGAYRAEVKIFEAGREAAQFKDLPVHVYQPAPLRHGSKFLSAQARPTKVRAGQTVVVTGLLKNEGLEAIKPVLYATIKRRGLVEDVARSMERQVAPGQEQEYKLTVKPRRVGQYALDVYFIYDESETDHKIFTLIVAARSPWYIYIIYILLILLSIAALALIMNEYINV